MVLSEKEDYMKGSTIYSVMTKSPVLETGPWKFRCQLILVGLLYQDFPDTYEQKQVLQETVIFFVIN